jgi:hypothetical protein
MSRTLNTVARGTALAALVAGALLVPLRGTAADQQKETSTIKGEVVDLMCYLDHDAKGEKHAKCAEKCIKAGGPVGLLSGDQVYLVIGDHEPINDKLAAKAGQTVTLKGNVVSRSGMKMIQHAELE